MRESWQNLKAWLRSLGRGALYILPGYSLGRLHQMSEENARIREELHDAQCSLLTAVRLPPPPSEQRKIREEHRSDARDKVISRPLTHEARAAAAQKKADEVFRQEHKILPTTGGVQ